MTDWTATGISALVGVVAWLVWTAILVHRVQQERHARVVWTRLLAMEAVVWALATTYALQALLWPDVDVVRMVGHAARGILLMVGVAVLVWRARTIR